eukprot:CAMPEP_0178418342 /NCGR_PEP_ID=MMETSP0689_2-20121128/25038_1 /TAXON_ID=160604 /ORGANISM="Amphidinium massartii, Strain CS-259" /LENGTH=332 /DNA_ID=CAMNT_0020039731 /DNA_START=66 /DNA_END=1061 /DNA_ORIENTATION=+
MAANAKLLVICCFLSAFTACQGFRSSSQITQDSQDVSLEVDNSALPDCLSIPGYAGQCMLSTSKGACYIKPGVPSEDNSSIDVRWACWAPSDDDLTDDQCKGKLAPSGKPVGYEGACIYKDYGKKKEDANITACESLPFYHTQCNPVSEKWGACYVEGSETGVSGWMCIEDQNPDIDSLRKGDCKTRSVINDLDHAYTDVCIFRNRVQTRYKCDTVPTYDTKVCNQDGTAGDKKGFGACFSQDKSIAWQCYEEDDLMLKNCETTPLPPDHGGDLAHWSGGCIFPGNKGYDDAEKYVPTTTTTTTTSASTTSTNAKGGAPSSTLSVWITLALM